VETILVTGACGGIGSKLIPVLLELGFRVIAVDNLYSGVWKNLETHENLVEVTLDVSDTKEVNRILSNAKFSYCIHLAAISSLPECQINPTRALEVNFLGTQVIAELCARQGGFKQFVFASTSAVYEGLRDEVLTEDLKVSPVLVYPQTKYLSELFLNSMHVSRKFPVVTLRLFNVFGDRQNINRKSPPLINYLVREISNGRRPTLFGWDAPGRDYISVNSVVRIMIKFLRVKESHGNIYNVCTGKTLTVRHIYSLVASTLNSDIEPNLNPPKDLWLAYPEISVGVFPLSSRFIEAETNKCSLGAPGLLLSIIGQENADNLEKEITETVLSITSYLKILNQ
jgi:UDP-glucose 4-epimerase